MTDNKVGLAGDWHGSFQWVRHALSTFGEAGIKDIFHVGDFSIAWPGIWPDLLNICEKYCKKYDMRLWITPGNHENWNWITSRKYAGGEFWMSDHVVLLERNWRKQWPYVDSRGSHEHREIVSLGGAPSIDFEHRTRHINWWPEEMILQREVDECVEGGHADIMLCHDAPDGGTQAVQDIIDTPWGASIWSHAGLSYAYEGRMMMNMAYEGVKPKVFAHGHFHVADSKQTDDTLFISLACNGMYNNLAVLDLETLDFEWLPLLEELPK